MADPLGYVVIEWNQASHQPSVVDGSFTTDLECAGEVAEDERRRTAAYGRRESYDVAEVVISDMTRWEVLP